MNPRVLGWLMPVICISLAVIALIYQAGNVLAAQSVFRAAQLTLSQAMSEKKAMPQTQRVKDRVGVDQSASEEPRFLAELYANAARRGVKIQKLTFEVLDFGPGVNLSRDSSISPDDALKLQGIEQKTTNLVVRGQYANLRSFLRDYTSAPRLYTVRNLKWKVDDADNEVTVTLSRYVFIPTEGKVTTETTAS